MDGRGDIRPLGEASLGVGRGPQLDHRYLHAQDGVTG